MVSKVKIEKSKKKELFEGYQEATGSLERGLTAFFI
jgi:hypothetical protein